MGNVVMKPSNRLGLDYRVEAAKFSRSVTPIIDVHTHIQTAEAAKIYGEVAKLYGISLTYSMTPFDNVDAVKEVLGERVRFIAIPDFGTDDPARSHGDEFLERIALMYNKGCRIVKFWSAPRGIDIGIKSGNPNLLRLDAPHRIEAMEHASGLGMIFMTHVGDPDTWFKTKYADVSIYGKKSDHHARLEPLLDRFPNPWIAAHMGGWPEDLRKLSGLLDRHPNLFLDSSATRWMVRELSKHSRGELLEFFDRWKGRILFGSDIVANDAHLKSEIEPAFDLYASRYFALRKLFETEYDGESPIADPDLALVDPDIFTPLDAPRLCGQNFPEDLLKVLYHGAASGLLVDIN